MVLIARQIAKQIETEMVIRDKSRSTLFGKAVLWITQNKAPIAQQNRTAHPSQDVRFLFVCIKFSLILSQGQWFLLLFPHRMQ